MERSSIEQVCRDLATVVGHPAHHRLVCLEQGRISPYDDDGERPRCTIEPSAGGPLTELWDRAYRLRLTGGGDASANRWRVARCSRGGAVTDPESLYAYLTRVASRTPNDRLRLALLGAIATGLLLVLVRAPLWPLAALFGAVGSVAGWGLVEHRAQEHPSRWLRITEWSLVTLGYLFAIATTVGVLLWALGDSWQL